MSEIATALKGMSGSSNSEGADTGFEEVLEQDGDDFDVDDLATLGLIMIEKPRLCAVYRSFRDRKEARQLFLRKLIRDHDQAASS
ncbi:hypothetical protein V8E36_003680 [Tilletia maclaganii]